jgi:hypothetical protein
MTPTELTAIGEALYGERWQSDLGRALGYKHRRTVQRWLDGTRRIPADLPARLRVLMADRREALALLETLVSGAGQP